MRFLDKFSRRKYSSAREEGRQADQDSISTRLPQNIEQLHNLFPEAPDLIIREFTIKKTGELAALAYFKGLSDKNAINTSVLRPLQFEIGHDNQDEGFALSVGPIQSLNTWSDIEASIFSGESILFVDGRLEAYALDTRGWPQRAIGEPQTESSLRGAHQGFVETGAQNIAMIRRYISNRELKIKELKAGRRGATKISLLYPGDVAHPEVLKELEDRISQLDVDVIINTGELAELIEDNPYSPFPQFILTERPDAAASQLLQGRIVVIVDRSPSVLVAPAGFTAFFQSIDDYSTRWLISSFIRLLRFLAFFIAILLPGLYIALISFNYELIPIKLFLTIGDFRGRVPFPPFVEAIIMEITLEMMREAGVRLPAPIGQTIGIVGGIVVGEAIVQAGVINNIMVIVVAFTAIASFILPNYDMVASVRIIRFLMMIAASMFGIVGIVVGMMILIGHIISLESLGTPYGSPIAPFRLSDWKDAFVRLPLWNMKTRPISARAIQSKRQGSSRPKGDGK
ncbi:spore germination protein [Paenibacillus arenilitoris]|uniref:Spore germination protein n=1 Tax=Paenibacillus arenilitoris TaxID=2772299 RepID=A0A927CI87_9BACL|nr:spore germination protein [Paenibacillus arenilitoris]MBD2867113.1 spore germination protein [Paenibacillus arenilitoris]